MTLKGKA